MDSDIEGPEGHSKGSAKIARPLTGVDFLEGDVFLQLAPDFHLCPIFAEGAVVGEDEVRMGIVEHREFA